VKARIHQGTPRNLARLARALRAGELVAVPTETVYGLAADALNPRACRAIFRAKGRPASDPLIVHIHAVSQVDELAVRNPALDKVAAAFWPGPLTVVLPKKACVPDIVTSGRPSVAIRLPSHPLFLELLRLTGRPLAAPSANRFSYVSPTTAQHVMDGLGRKIPHILDGGAATIGLESTILDLRNPARPRILRPGAIDRGELERVLGCRVAQSRPVAKRDQSAVAPGSHLRHYSPRTPVTLHRRITPAVLRNAAAGDVFLLLKPLAALSAGIPASVAASTGKPGAADRTSRKAQAPRTKRIQRPATIALSPDGDLERCARSLFATLRELDRTGWKHIHAELAPGRSALALAINDRLRRAAARKG
jgi:L-threonylcarbamoyladenylate synthase